MNDTMGNLPDDPYVRERAWQSRTMADIRNPSPSGRWVFVDEHPDSISFGSFGFNPGYNQWIHLPASHHNGACGLVFADGHTEVKKWRFASTIQPVRLKLFVGQPIPRNEEADFLWFKERTIPR